MHFFITYETVKLIGWLYKWLLVQLHIVISLFTDCAIFKFDLPPSAIPLPFAFFGSFVCLLWIYNLFYLLPVNFWWANMKQIALEFFALLRVGFISCSLKYSLLLLWVNGDIGWQVEGISDLDTFFKTNRSYGGQSAFDQTSEQVTMLPDFASVSNLQPSQENSEESEAKSSAQADQQTCFVMILLLIFEV